MTSSLLQIKIFDSIEHIGEERWTPLTPPNFPFAEYAFLAALESSMCVGHAAGWIPKYITVWRDEQLVGASFVYIKTNSYGEYIFDWDWAKAYHHHRLEYFPKLTSSIPFTPATGPKFLVRSDQDSTPEHPVFNLTVGLKDSYKP